MQGKNRTGGGFSSLGRDRAKPGRTTYFRKRRRLPNFQGEKAEAGGRRERNESRQRLVWKRKDSLHFLRKKKKKGNRGREGERKVFQVRGKRGEKESVAL